MEQTVPSISAIIVSWDAKKYLEQCIQSIINYSESCETQIIVVDNASSDGSSEMVQK
jgi:GT2 family glycosyltransferase